MLFRPLFDEFEMQFICLIFRAEKIYSILTNMHCCALCMWNRSILSPTNLFTNAVNIDVSMIITFLNVSIFLQMNYTHFTVNKFDWTGFLLI